MGGGDGLEITYNDPVRRFPDLDFQTLLQVTGAMRLMTNMWTMTGIEEVDSKQEYDQSSSKYKKVRQCLMTQFLSYHDFFFRKAMEHPGPPHKAIAWLVDRDSQTRAKARQLFQQGWPWGEALLHARDVLCHVLWTCGAKDITDEQPPVIGELDEDAIMEDQNDTKAVTNRERQRLQQLEAAEAQRQRSRQAEAQSSKGQP